MDTGKSAGGGFLRERAGLICMLDARTFTQLRTKNKE